MTSAVNSLSANKSQPLVPSSSINLEDEKNKEKKKKTQFISQMEGNYFCTYLIDGNGNKTLLNRIPAAQVDKQATSPAANSSLAFEKLKNPFFHKVNGGTDLIPFSNPKFFAETCIE